MKFKLLLYLIHLQLLSYLLNSFLMSINFIINYTIDYLKFILLITFRHVVYSSQSFAIKLICHVEDPANLYSHLKIKIF
jgi:hypothetical protein